jgi:lysophospholipase L1-like esterase
MRIDFAFTRQWHLAAALCASMVLGATHAQPAGVARFKFEFGPGPVSPGYIQVLPTMIYSTTAGFGFEPGADLQAIDRGSGDSLHGGLIASATPFFFSVAVPEGNFKVTVKLGDPRIATDNTIYAELRRLMLERVTTEPGTLETRSFIVNVRRPEISGGRAVRLKDREHTTEAWAWDDRLTIEFNGSHPSVITLEIEKVDVPTIYLLGDSTMCDQPREPFNSWGQMLTRFLKPAVAVANHAESGESVSGALAALRFDKIWSEMKKGDYLFVQFGHNDMKSEEAGALQTYTANMKRIVDETRRRGGIPVLVSSVSRRTFDAAGKKIIDSFKGYTQAVREVAREKGVPLIDLQASSAAFYEALGPEASHLAFATPQEGTHHSDYGSYEIAKCVLMGIKEARLDLATSITDDFNTFDPSTPDPIDRFSLSKSPLRTSVTPLGR